MKLYIVEARPRKNAELYRLMINREHVLEAQGDDRGWLTDEEVELVLEEHYRRPMRVIRRLDPPPIGRAAIILVLQEMDEEQQDG